MAPTSHRITWIVAVIIAFALVSTLVYRGSWAAFSTETDNGVNSWETGLLLLTDNDAGVAMFDEDVLLPGASGENCITVANDGDVTLPEVKLYATTGGALADDVDLVIEQGTSASGTFGSCADFSSVGDVYDGPLSGLPTTYAAGRQLDGDGNAPWTPAVDGTRTFRFAWSLDSSLGNTLQNSEATATFTWGSQSP